MAVRFDTDSDQSQTLVRDKRNCECVCFHLYFLGTEKSTTHRNLFAEHNQVEMSVTLLAINFVTVKFMNF